MKQIIALCLGAALLAGCSANTDNKQVSPFDSRFKCDVPTKESYPLVGSKGDLLSNMKQLGTQVEAANFVGAQWLARIQEQKLNGKELVDGCLTAYRDASRAIIAPQYEKVMGQITQADERATLQDVYQRWEAYIQSVTIKGVNDSLRNDFIEAAQKYAAMR